jgi:hypothetical protein
MKMPIRDINMPRSDWKNGRADAKGECCLEEWESRCQGRVLLEAVEEEKFEQFVRFSTNIKGNVLDLVITNC